MNERRIHRAVSHDGTEIQGRVYGEGPPLVLVHGACADESEWNAAIPALARAFTCYAISTRCRGLSGHNDDLTPDRLVEDVTAVADSIGQPVRVAGISGGAMSALAAAARTSSIAAVATWEPPVFQVVTEKLAAEMADVLNRMSEQYTAGDAVGATRTFLSFVGNDYEMAALEESGELTYAARYVPVDLREIEAATMANGSSPTDPSVLAKIHAPVLLLRGTATRQQDWFSASLEFAADHVPDARLRVVPGVGHLSCQVTPEPITAELIEFFSSP